MCTGTVWNGSYNESLDRSMRLEHPQGRQNDENLRTGIFAGGADLLEGCVLQEQGSRAAPQVQMGVTDQELRQGGALKKDKRERSQVQVPACRQMRQLLLRMRCQTPSDQLLPAAVHSGAGSVRRRGRLLSQLFGLRRVSPQRDAEHRHGLGTEPAQREGRGLLAVSR